MKDTLSHKAGRLSRLHKALAIALTVALVVETMPLKGALAFAAEVAEGAQATQNTQAGGGASEEVAPDGSPSGSGSATGEKDARAEAGSPATLTFENDDLVVTMVEATDGAIPSGTTLDVREVTPSATETRLALEEEGADSRLAKDNVDQYTEAVRKISDHVAQDEKSVADARVYDIRLLDADGNEVEPNGTVRVAISYRQKAELAQAETDSSNVAVAHVKDDGQVETVDASITSDEAGRLESTEFHADSLSLYVVFDTGTTSTTAPVSVGNYGWIRFGGNVWQADSIPGQGFDNNGWARYLKVNVYTLRSGQDPSNPASYDLGKAFQYVSSWDDWSVESSKFAGTVKMTYYRQAHSQDWQRSDSLQTSYAAVPCYRATDWTLRGFPPDTNELNVYIDTNQAPNPPVASAGTSYLIRYYHADGSFDTKDGTLSEGQTLSVSKDDHHVEGEKYAGMTLTAGNDAVSSIDTKGGNANIGYNAGVRLVKMNVYYEEDIERKAGGTVDGRPQYDTKVENGTKVYDTSRSGLHTDKTASVHVGADGTSDGRTFDLKLESWNVGDNMANVGMVLDASGSMVWASNTPAQISRSQAEWRGLIGWYWPYRVLSEDQVNKILDTKGTDNTKLNYNDYKYYIYDTTASVNEYVPLGYSDGSVSNNVLTMNGHTMATADPYGRGWYYVNSTGYDAYAKNEPHGAKQYIGVPNTHTWKSRGASHTISLSNQNDIEGTDNIQGLDTNNNRPAYFYIDNAGNLKTLFFYNHAYHTSYVYQKADDADTKSEALQHSIARFTTLLDSMSPDSMVGMTRFSREQFSSDELALLNWTDDPSTIIGALNQQYGNANSEGGSASAWQDGLRVYNYGFTGATHTYKGIGSFIDKLTRGQWQGYAPTRTNGNPSKYLIVFTDGKDNSGKMQDSISYANSLKGQGYTIITVLMQSAGMTEKDKSDSKAFLENLASPDSTGMGGTDGKLFFSSAYDDPEGLAEVFEKIAKGIAKPLEGYTVTDYIDPRLDLLDADGNVLTRLNADGSFVDRPIRTADGKTATLKHDAGKKMFYVEVTGQTIPSTAPNAKEVGVWDATLTVRAKDDFLGGNDILSNGNEPGQNRVYDPADGSKPHKDFPWTSVNPRVLGLATKGYEDTIFEGEDVDPEALYDRLAASADSAWFVEYLERIGARDNKDYVAQLKSGKDVSVDYYYLAKPGDETSYAGGERHQGDKVGRLEYKWSVTDVGGNNPANAYERFTTTTTNDVRYKLTVTYNPDRVDYGSWDRYADNGTPRTLALTGQWGTDKLVRDPVGDEQTAEVKAEAEAVIHAVDGRILVQKRVNKESLLTYLGTLGSGDSTLTFALERTYGGKTQAAYRSFQVKLTNGTGAGSTTGEVSTVTRADVERMEADANGDVTIASQWETGLPIGTYKLTEQLSDADSFSSPAFEGVAADQITDDPSTADFVEKQELAAALTADDGSVTFYVGQVHDGMPSQCSYPASDFSQEKVVDANKEVDPELSKDGGKFYLNAQVGEARVKNLPKPGFTVLKRDASDHHALQGATFELFSADGSWAKGDKVSEATSDKDGLASFSKLSDGNYLLYETRAATGYLAPSEPWHVKVSGGKVADFSTAGGSSVPNDEGHRYLIDNSASESLPSTGGNGLLAAYLLAAVVLAVTAATLRRRHASREGGGPRE